MSRPLALITMASWEDRFRLGFSQELRRNGATRVIMFHFGAPYASWTAANRDSVRQECSAINVGLDAIELSIDEAASNWSKVAVAVSANVQQGSRTVVDLSTMPREIIWWVFWHCERLKVDVEYVYHRPASYGDWLSREPQRPRLIYRMSGIASLRRKTALVATAGYDVERCQQLMNVFEPSIALIGLQGRSLDPQNPDQMRRYRERFKDSGNVSFFETDAYAVDHGRSTIECAIAQVRLSHNVILSSLGPKLSAVALYRIQRDDPSLALAYAPSKEFSQEYSKGIGGVITGHL
jgi:hypothetical protein